MLKKYLSCLVDRACPPLEGLPASGGPARLWRACPPLEGLPASGVSENLSRASRSNEWLYVIAHLPAPLGR